MRILPFSEARTNCLFLSKDFMSKFLHRPYEQHLSKSLLGGFCRQSFPHLEFWSSLEGGWCQPFLQLCKGRSFPMLGTFLWTKSAGWGHEREHEAPELALWGGKTSRWGSVWNTSPCRRVWVLLDESFFNSNLCYMHQTPHGMEAKPQAQTLNLSGSYFRGISHGNSVKDITVWC